MNKSRIRFFQPLYYLLSFFSILLAQPIFSQEIPSHVLNETRSFEVSACIPAKDKIISVWMEKRPERKDNDENAADMRVAYKSSVNGGKDWSQKAIVDLPNTFGTGNPYVTANESGEAYMVCMHIGKDFYSGNISLYEFDNQSKQFTLKSIPFKSDFQLLDKPAIVSFGKEIHLVYVAYSKRARNSVKYQVSTDKGKTWSKPVDVFPPGKNSFLGPSISKVKGKGVIVSAGAYGRGNIYVTTRKTTVDSIAFDQPVSVAQVSPTLGAAMSELFCFNNKLIITWQNAHQRGETWLSYSTDEGEKWSEPVLVCKFGNLLSAVFDKKGDIHCIYSDFGNEKHAVGYKKMNSQFQVLKESYILPQFTHPDFKEYLGAYQRLLIDDKNLYAFYIDYPNNNTLKFAKWKF